VVDLIKMQLMDPLRIGLIVGLVITMIRTRAATGTMLPLAAGVVFVAVILPVTNAPVGVSLAQAVLAGIVSNVVILGIVLALAQVIRRLRG
jgi:hypothetical protein